MSCGCIHDIGMQNILNLCRGMNFARVACKSQKEEISYTSVVYTGPYRNAVTSIFARPYNIIYIFYINLRCVHYVRFPAAGQSNLLTTRTRRTSTYHRNVYVYTRRTFV